MMDVISDDVTLLVMKDVSIFREQLRKFEIPKYRRVRREG